MAFNQEAIPPFKHDPLMPGENIRVLFLEPSRDSDSAIQCILLDKPLSECHGIYEALSYVWGSTDMNCKIYCNEQPLYVNMSCYMALKNLRNKKKYRMLWIDNICIDQSSNEERGHQVELMGSIYRNARTVIVWLGEEEPETKRAFRRRRYGHILWNISRKFHVPYSLQTGFVLPRKEDEKLLFQRLCRHEWPLRVWTLQEFLMSSGHQVIQSGPYTLPFDAFYTSSGYQWSGYPGQVHEWEIWGQCTTARAYWLDRVSERADRSLRDPSGSALSAREIWEWLLTIAEIWDNASKRSCSDPLDRVYGVYGLLRNMGVEIPRPDYSKTVSQIVRELTFSTISFCGSFAPLHYFADQCSRPDTTSWAVDWARFDRDTNFRRFWGVRKQDFATFQKSHWPDIVEDRLRMKAILSSTKPFGTTVPCVTVQNNIPPGRYNAYQSAMPKLAVLNWLRETMELAKAFQACPDGQLACQAVSAALIGYRGSHDRGLVSIDDRSRTVMGNLLACGIVASSPERHSEIIATQSQLDTPRLRVRHGEPIKQEDAHFDDDEVMKDLMFYLTDTTSRCQGGGLFSTPEGWDGLAMRPVESGDVLARIHGSSVPAILRPTGEYFRLLCFASMEGIPGDDWSINGDEEGVQSIELI